MRLRLTKTLNYSSIFNTDGKFTSILLKQAYFAVFYGRKKRIGRFFSQFHHVIFVRLRLRAPVWKTRLKSGRTTFSRLVNGYFFGYEFAIDTSPGCHTVGTGNRQLAHG